LHTTAQFKLLVTLSEHQS